MSKHLLFLFLDGVGLGPDDPAGNPLARAEMPHLRALLGGRALVNGGGLPLENERASLLALDANLGVPDLPQSATGQAVLLTGRNIPAELGYHYGPKPNPAVAAYLEQDTLFHRLGAAGKRCGLLSGYPPRYFSAIASGKRLYSAVPLAASRAGLRLRDDEDIRQGQALPADLTGAGWMQQPGFPVIPVQTPEQAGRQLAAIARQHDFSFFEYWLSDYAGHQQDWPQALKLLSDLDAFLGGLLAGWDNANGLILLTSDHGNLEDLSTRRHTANPVPALLVGQAAARRQFADGLRELSGVAGKVLDFLG